MLAPPARCAAMRVPDFPDPAPASPERELRRKVQSGDAQLHPHRCGFRGVGAAAAAPAHGVCRGPGSAGIHAHLLGAAAAGCRRQNRAGASSEHAGLCALPDVRRRRCLCHSAVCRPGACCRDWVPACAAGRVAGARRDRTALAPDRPRTSGEHLIRPENSRGRQPGVAPADNAPSRRTPPLAGFTSSPGHPVRPHRDAGGAA